MTLRNTLVTSAAVLAMSSFIVASPAVFSHPDNGPAHRPHPGNAQGHMMRRMVDKLSLTEEQIELLQVSFKPESDNSEQLRGLNKQLRELTFSDGYSDSMANDLSQQIATLMQENRVQRSKAQHAFYDSLSDEQKASLNEIESRRSERPRRVSLSN